MKQLITSLLAITAIGITACSQAESPNTQSSKAVNTIETKTKAVLIYADWCGSCKTLDPKINEVKSKETIPGLEYVTLDFTDKKAENFYKQAEAAGVREAVETYLAGKIKTGQLVLVDMDDQKVLGKVTKTFEHSEIITALTEAVSAS